MGKILKVLLVVNVLMLNVIVGVFVWSLYVGFNLDLPKNGEAGNEKTFGSVEYVDTCGSECRAAIIELTKPINDELLVLNEKISTIPTQRVVPTSGLIPTKSLQKVKAVTYLPIPSSGTSIETDWKDLNGTEFYFDKADYSGLQEISFEANVKLLNGNGIAYFRLYDATHGIGIQGSELQTSNQSSTVITSSKLNFWSGKNLIRVQAKTLTADTAVYDSGRVKIVTEN